MGKVAGMSSLVLPPQHLLQRFDVSGPRYTSYPTADRFAEPYAATEYRLPLESRARGLGVAGGAGMPLALYVHLPFCESVCYYCACNKIITRRHERADEYLDVLAAEIALHTGVLGPGVAVGQLHLG